MSESPKAGIWEPGRALISRANVWTFAGVLLVLFLVGTLWDMQISELLFDPAVLDNPFHANFLGVFGAAYGEIPSGLALVVAGTLLLVYRNRDRVWLAVIQAGGGVLLFILGSLMVMYMPTRYVLWPTALVLSIGAVIVAGVTFGVVRLARGTDRAMAVRVAVVMLLVVVIELILINVIKVGWERPRMRMLEELAADGNTALSFHSWWQPGTPERGELITSGVTVAEEFKSFPSGHTANAAVAILLTSLVVLRPSLWAQKAWLFWGGAAWALYVGFSRIIMGAHFLTDTVTGLTITFVVILVAYRVAFPARKAAA